MSFISKESLKRFAHSRTGRALGSATVVLGTTVAAHTEISNTPKFIIPHAQAAENAKSLEQSTQIRQPGEFAVVSPSGIKMWGYDREIVPDEYDNFFAQIDAELGTPTASTPRRVIIYMSRAEYDYQFNQNQRLSESYWESIFAQIRQMLKSTTPPVLNPNINPVTDKVGADLVGVMFTAGSPPASDDPPRFNQYGPRNLDALVGVPGSTFLTSSGHWIAHNALDKIGILRLVYQIADDRRMDYSRTQMTTTLANSINSGHHSLSVSTTLPGMYAASNGTVDDILMNLTGTTLRKYHIDLLLSRNTNVHSRILTEQVRYMSGDVHDYLTFRFFQNGVDVTSQITTLNWWGTVAPVGDFANKSVDYLPNISGYQQIESFRFLPLEEGGVKPNGAVRGAQTNLGSGRVYLHALNEARWQHTSTNHIQVNIDLYAQGTQMPTTESINTVVPLQVVNPTVTPTPSSTRTFTPTPTATRTFTPTVTPTHTETRTVTPTNTNTSTAIPTSTETASSTPTATFTLTNTPRPTDTAIPSATETPTATRTPVPNTETSTYTPTQITESTATNTVVAEPTRIDVPTPTPEVTSTPIPAETPTPVLNPGIPTPLPNGQRQLFPLIPVHKRTKLLFPDIPVFPKPEGMRK